MLSETLQTKTLSTHIPSNNHPQHLATPRTTTTMTWEEQLLEQELQQWEQNNMNNNKKRKSQEQSQTVRNHTRLARHGLECLTKYSNIPSPGHYSACFSGLIAFSRSSFFNLKGAALVYQVSHSSACWQSSLQTSSPISLSSGAVQSKPFCHHPSLHSNNLGN